MNDNTKGTVGAKVKGYRDLDETSVETVNCLKVMEERVLRIIDELTTTPGIDQRWLSIGKTDLQKGFMAVNRSVFNPTRIDLPEDG